MKAKPPTPPPVTPLANELRRKGFPFIDLTDKVRWFCEPFLTDVPSANDDVPPPASA